MSYTHRYLVRFWSTSAGRMIPDAGYHDYTTAMVYLARIMSTDSRPRQGDIFDQEINKVAFTMTDYTR